MYTRERKSQSRSFKANKSSYVAQYYDATKGKEFMNFTEFVRATGCKSETFAVRLFICIDANHSGCITLPEYLEGLRRLLSEDMDERIRYVFSILDLDGDGSITGAELKSVLTASVEGENPDQTENEGNQLAQALMQICDKDSDSVISYQEFVRVVKLYPDLLKGLTFGRCGLRTVAPSRVVKKKKFRWVRKAASWVMNNPQILFTYLSAVLLVLGFFMWSFLKYTGDCTGVDMKARDPITGYSREDVMHLAQEHEWADLSAGDERYMVFSSHMEANDPIECRRARKRLLMGWTFPVAKGSGEALKVVLMLILFPVSRNLMTLLRNSVLRHVFFFDGAIDFHKFLGKMGFWMSWIHALTHLRSMINMSNPNRYRYWSWAFPEDRTANEIQGLSFDENERPVQDSMGRTVYSEETEAGLPWLFFNDQPQADLKDSLQSQAVFSGVVLIAIYTFAALFAFDYPKKLFSFKDRSTDSSGWLMRCLMKIGQALNDFNNFWYSHHLFALFYLVLLFHPTPDLPDHRKEWGWSDSWLWVGIPVFIYTVERSARVKRSIRKTEMVSAELLPGDVVGLTFLRPRGFRYSPGQYIFIRCPQISWFEWHPFTLTTSPGDSCLGVHVRKAGDWTTALHNLVEQRQSQKTSGSSHMDTFCDTVIEHIDFQKATGHAFGDPSKEGADCVDRFGFSISVDGPFGAPTQRYDDYRVIVLIGAGIGVTPFASVLSSLLDSLKESACLKCGHCNIQHMQTPIRKVYFYWTVRSRSEATWFKSLLEAISLRDEEGLLEINIYITGTAEATSLRRMVRTLTHLESGDISSSAIALSRVVTRFGHIHWPDIFEKVQQDFPAEPSVGVFFSGPNTTAKSVSKMCRMNSKGATKFDFMQESFG